MSIRKKRDEFASAYNWDYWNTQSLHNRVWNSTFMISYQALFCLPILRFSKEIPAILHLQHFPSPLEFSFTPVCKFFMWILLRVMLLLFFSSASLCKMSQLMTKSTSLTRCWTFIKVMCIAVFCTFYFLTVCFDCINLFTVISMRESFQIS